MGTRDKGLATNISRQLSNQPCLPVYNVYLFTRFSSFTRLTYQFPQVILDVH